VLDFVASSSKYECVCVCLKVIKHTTSYYRKYTYLKPANLIYPVEFLTPVHLVLDLTVSILIDIDNDNNQIFITDCNIQIFMTEVTGISGNPSENSSLGHSPWESLAIIHKK
jgi:hypothetical protein